MKYISNLLIILLITVTTCFAWNDEETHPTLSEFAAESYFGAEFMGIFINGVQVKKLIRDGSKLEDTGTPVQFFSGMARSLNHFHNPARATLGEAGLTDIPWYMSPGMSTPLWAQDADYQKTKVNGDWSWKKVRDLYYKSLTTTDKAIRELWQADYLKGLGYQMHLIQDMGQPNHVRNDTHILDGASWIMGFETWARVNNVKVKKDILGKTTIPTVTVDLKPDFTDDAGNKKVPVARLFDSRGYKGTRLPTADFNQGLAEYTNSNFFSESTVFAAEGFAGETPLKRYNPYPNKSETNVQNYINNQLAATVITDDGDVGPFATIIISKQNNATGEKLKCLATTGPLTNKILHERGEDKYFYRSFMYDACFPEYAEKLIPASAAYSIAMLDYFDRGKLNVTAAPDGITFRSIKVNASNNTPGEALGLGDVSLVVRYKVLTETSLGGDKYLLNLPADEYTYKVITLPTKVDMSSPQALTFNLSSAPLPMNFSDMTMQLVYRGPLGNESDAVAVSKLEQIDGIYTDFNLSLPPSGVFAKVNNTPDATFNELRVTAMSDIPGGLSGGTIKLALEYRTAIGDQFQSVLVDTEPASGAAYILSIPEKNHVNTLPQHTPVELVFDLSVAPLTIGATDVEINVVYTKADGSQDIGVRNISEPTPVDVYNNTDYACLNGTWYRYDDPAAMAIVDSNGDGIADKADIYPHTINNISFLGGPSNAANLDATTSSTLFDAGPLPPGQMLRLGYILTDYTNRYATNETRTGLNGDLWPHLPVNNRNFSGTGFRDVSTAWSSMFAFRGIKMWWGAGPVFINPEYNGTCTWDALNKKLGF